ncbi:hypothetical protein CYLTODRAFT_420660 [Cylindrobasidium torrendii FP15055 ss-10]|uniref:Uncharacterized protein n=1 Tax=Cylindrobasidium torrendii FP15055 ss-10 TaxID=1314674 RepID=A0A0D7BIK4_9AGAR|nr:hypothetical protein CYLTODRAFT_420660 [Cylindrobasidium torrendii FP15055 ss-10]
MLSSFRDFGSFLPSAFQKPPPPSPQINVNEDADEDAAAKEEAEREGESKKKKLNETFIVVRPPPAMSNHPLNLQVQLVPPGAKASGVTPRASMDSSMGDAASSSSEGVPLSRTSSNRSDYSSTASFSSFSSSASGRRTIIPLYNLQAHNVLTNTVVDAGTDAKIARFGRRGMEMMELVQVEPVEVWAVRDGAERVVDVTRITQGGLAASTSGTNSASPSRPSTPATTPGSSSLSLQSSAPSHSHSHAAPPPEPPKKRENLFGRMFKKTAKPMDPVVTPTKENKRASIQIGALNLGGGGSGPGAGSSRHSKRLSMSSNSPYLDVQQHDTSQAKKRLSMSSSTSIGADGQSQLAGPAVPQAVLLPGTLGIQPLLNVSIPPPASPALLAALVSLFTATAYPPSFARGKNPFVGRGPAMYVWTVRKWYKGEGGSMLASMLNPNARTAADAVDLRFEWRKGKPKPKGGRRPGTRQSKRESMRSTLSSEDEEDADPEDSETPWTCTLRLKPTAKGTGKGVIKVKVGTLSPTPHHPKVVAMLKVPYPLPDVQVESMRIAPRKFVDGEEGVRRVVHEVEDDGTHGLVLTAEEIKDIVSSTGLWLIVREGFGGVGKVSRKGDGWRIRA